MDVIGKIGWCRDREHLNREQIHTYLGSRGVQLSERQVDHLYTRYQVLLGCTARLDKPKLKKIAEERGGLCISSGWSGPRMSLKAVAGCARGANGLHPNCGMIAPSKPRDIGRPIYDRDSELKTEMRKTIRKGIRESTREVLTEAEAAGFSLSDHDGDRS